MDVVNAWCKGGSFSSIVELTDVYEGSIIRAMRRLEELLRDMCHAAKGLFIQKSRHLNRGQEMFYSAKVIFMSKRHFFCKYMTPF